MSKVVKTKVKVTKKAATVSPFSIYWDKVNYVLFALGIVLSIIGYYMLSVKPWDSSTSLVVSPIILFIAYAVVFPAAIFYRSKNTDEKEAA